MQNLLSPKQVSEITGLSLNTLKDWRHKGYSPEFIKLGNKKVMYIQESVEDYLEGCIINKTLSREDEIVSNIIDDLIAKRKQLGLSQSGLAQRTNLSASMIKRVEGKASAPTLSALLAISKALDIFLDTLIQKYDPE